MVCRSEFADPMILAATGWSPAYYLVGCASTEDIHAYIEPISAIDVLTQMNPIQHMRYIHISPAVPPSIKPIVDVLSQLVSSSPQ